MTENTSVAKKKGFKMLDIYIVLACFILGNGGHSLTSFLPGTMTAR